ncbi:hypothetical protein [Methanoregula sp.]|uniref:hypothetical protein n=1 Tax=Methanoregula sp. TaxID=2052170 RepID=UPI003C72EFD0
MRTPGLLTGFLPLIVYGILSGAMPGNVQIALLAACIVSLLAGFRLLLRGFILEWANFLMFTAALFCVSVVHIRTVGEYMSVLIYLVLALVASGSLLAGIPFTIQYARDMVDRSLWDHPVFRSVNAFMTGVWGALFVVNLVLVLYAMTVTGPAAGVAAITTYAVLVIGVVFTVRYPAYIRKKQHASPVPELP